MTLNVNSARYPRLLLSSLIIKFEYGEPKTICVVLEEVPIVIKEDLIEIYLRMDLRKNFVEDLEKVLKYLSLLFSFENLALQGRSE